MKPALSPETTAPPTKKGPAAQPTLAGYLEAVAAGCREVATKPSPKMIATIRGVLQLAPRTIDEIQRVAAEA